MTESAALDETKLLAILESEETDAVGYFRSEIAEDQEQALRYYQGQPFGDEVTGRSQVVSMDVRETVEWLVPDMARIFMSGHQVAEAIPQSQEDVEAAKQATDYCNFVFLQDNPGFQLWQDWAKDGLIQKIGIMRVDWEEPDWLRPEHYRNLNTAELQELEDLEEAEQLEILEHDEEETEVGSYYFDGYVHEVRIRRKSPYGRVVINPIAPEEFLVKRASRTLDESLYRAHRTYKTLSELIEMFPEHEQELNNALPSDDDEDLDTRKQTRFQDEDYYPTDAETPIDRSTTMIKFLDEYIMVDYDGDGIAELRNVKRAGHLILFNEEVDEDPFVDWCPIHVPHKFYGLSMADETMDIQRTKSVLWRAALDSTYLQVSPRNVVRDNVVNMDDLLTVRPGMNVRVDETWTGPLADAFAPIIVPDVTGSAYQMLEYVDQEAEGRTGVSRYSQGLDPDTLNKTATGIQLLQNASNGRKEMIARNMAFGLEKLFKKILAHLTRSESAARIIRLRDGDYVEMDPANWNPNMDMRVHVGLGTGSREQQMTNLGFILSNQKEIMLATQAQNPVVNWQNMYECLTELSETAGFKDAERFFSNPKHYQPPPPQPDPEIQKEQIKAETKLKEAEQKGQIDLAQMQQEGQIKAEERSQDALHAQAELRLKEAIAEAELMMKERLALMEMAMKERLGAMEMDMKERMGVVSETGKIEQAKIKTDVRVGGEPG